jgi:hypothetical protein
MYPSKIAPTPPEILHQRAASIRAVRGTEQNIFTSALAALEQTASAGDIPVAIIGGLAGIRHGALVTTAAIDVVVPQEFLTTLLWGAAAQGFRVMHCAGGRSSLEYRDGADTIAVEVFTQGLRTPRDPADAPSIPHPRELGVEHGLGYASFPAWVSLKLVSNRDKDQYHLIEALKVASPEETAACVVAVRKLPQRYMTEFERLVRAAEEERYG